MIRKTVEKTLHSGRTFERAQLTQLSGCKSVQRRSFQLTDVNAWRSVAQQESILSPKRSFLGSAGSLPAVFGSLRNTDLVGKLPTSAGWQPTLPGIFARKVRPKNDPLFRYIVDILRYIKLKAVRFQLIDSSRQSGSDRGF
jgi:hypothetical protein